MFRLSQNLEHIMSLQDDVKKHMIARSIAILTPKVEENNKTIAGKEDADGIKRLAVKKTRRKIQKAFELLLKTDEVVDEALALEGLGKLFEACGYLEAAVFYSDEKDVKKKKTKEST